MAELECGHTQHVRHDPPWQVRSWVTSEEGRRSRLQAMLECPKCKEEFAGSSVAVARED